MNPWQPSPLLKFSLAAHAAAAGVVVLNPALWPWAVGGVLADHAVLTASGLWPRSALLGPNWTRLPPPAQRRREIAITLDDGPDPEVTPRVLDILDRHRVVATFFCIGRRVAEHPALAREIVRRGHSIENHSQDHRHDFSFRGPRRMRAEISAAQDVIGAAVGMRPGFFRAPAGLRNPFLDPVLAGLGLELASWTRRGFDTVVGHPASVLARLVRRLDAGDILLLHDGHAARSEAGSAVILEVLPPLCAAIHERALIPVTLRAAREAGVAAPAGPAPRPES